MLMVFGMAMFALGVALVPAAHVGFRHPAASPKLRAWVSGEAAGVMLTTIPAMGLIALLYFLVDKSERNIGVVETVAVIAIAAAGWFATRWLLRLGARLEQEALDQEKAAGPLFPEKRAA